MKKIEQRKCAICGKKFTPKAANALYCSKKCYKVGKAAKGKALKAAKKVGKKPVKLTEKVVLPKKPTKKIVVKEVIHTVKPNDIIRFDKSFEPERVLAYAVRLECLALKAIAERCVAKKGKAK